MVPHVKGQASLDRLQVAMEHGAQGAHFQSLEQLATVASGWTDWPPDAFLSGPADGRRTTSARETRFAALAGSGRRRGAYLMS